ncbi:hypothetical protein K504DRAFT_94009 [Pleomassaria siparia CBS 279.74]|uniref:Uncharacterized protein n=1 Tax=Pleomassaria siparia CBS 279.74 TaxID=1314801 RepID=A0A6G1JYE8_9PLEO|nr:hypothetical protein K504DRAFT_94009 [Pleomassaria siparia CBS 279.74]
MYIYWVALLGTLVSSIYGVLGPLVPWYHGTVVPYPASRQVDLLTYSPFSQPHLCLFLFLFLFLFFCLAWFFLRGFSRVIVCCVEFALLLLLPPPLTYTHSYTCFLTSDEGGPKEEGEYGVRGNYGVRMGYLRGYIHTYIRTCAETCPNEGGNFLFWVRRVRYGWLAFFPAMRF